MRLYAIRAMIEFCTRKRMVIAIVILITVTAFVLLLENGLKPRASHDFLVKSQTLDLNQTVKPCYDEADVEVAVPCEQCVKHDRKIMPYCMATGYKEKVYCRNNSSTTYRSCPRPGLVAESHFWIFEGGATVLGIAAYCLALSRQRRLDKLLLEKVHKQIAAGV